MHYDSFYDQNGHSLADQPIESDALATLKKELAEELENIASFWLENTVDFLHGGFFGKMNNHGVVFVKAPKHACLNAGILWSLSAAYNRTSKAAFRNGADRAYAYIERHFIDHAQGGVFQSVDPLGHPLNREKCVYTLASTILGLCEYYSVTGLLSVRDLAIRLYEDLITYGYDAKNGGYFNTFEDKAKADSKEPCTDAENEVKSTKCHLRVLKSFVELYKIWPDEALKERINQLVGIFLEKILNPHTWSLQLYFNASWHSYSHISCFGFNMAASWLLSEAARAIEDYSLLYKTEQISDRIIEKAYIARDLDGGWWHEAFYPNDILNKEKHGWAQVHTILALVQAGRRKRQSRHIEDALQNWRFIKDKICDKTGGEWFYGIYENGSVMREEDKVGAEKCPFYNSFLCAHLLKTLAPFPNPHPDL